MNIFVSGKFEDRKEIKNLLVRLENLGHKITYDWTDHIPIKPYIDNQELANKYCVNELEGILKCDVLIYLSDKKGTTLKMEYGAALIRSLIEKYPIIYAVGEYNDASPWFFHENTRRRDSIEEVIEEISEIKAL